jgi:hypothetical protein
MFIPHIPTVPYNSQANGIVERRHRDVREALIKAADGDESKWPALSLLGRASYSSKV